MPEMTENQTPGHKPRKKKNKESHNAVERQRKEKINAGINRIGDLLPCSQALKQSKNMILDQAYRYITELQKQNDAMLLEGGDLIQAEEIRRLRHQMDELRKESGHYIELLKAHDINFLDDPTVHWKGKLRCAKVAKVTPTHQLPKRIIVYSSGNVIRPAGKEPSPVSDLGKQHAEAVIVQSSCDITAGVRVNGVLQHVSVPSSAPPLLPGASLTPTVATPGIRLVEQCVAEVPSAPKLPPSVSYFTLQGLCPLPTVTTALPQPATPAPSLTVAASLATQLPIQPVPGLTALPQVITTQNTASRTLSYTTIPSSSTLLRASAAGSTQTTWTTLQLTGNTVQPVCQSLSTQETSATGQQSVQQVSVCPMGTKPSVQPIRIQMRTQVPIQPQAPITAHIQAQPSIQRTPQPQPAILAQHQPQAVMALKPQGAILPQSAIMPQPAVVAHSAMMSQPQPAVLQQATVLPHPQTALMNQPQPHPQTAVMPLLQTMQVLQVNPAGTTVSGVTAPQNTNNPNVVILQQTNPCSAQSVVREDLTNQTPCQHIVIIQASNQPPPAPPQNPQVGMVPTTAPVVPNQIVATSCTTSTTGQQIFGGKQLVHILPRPVPQTQAPPVPPTPQTITVNGQVFSLQPMKTSDKYGSQGGQSSLQLIQPTTVEEPTTNVALHTLGALSSLNKSISQGMPPCISTQSNVQLTLPSNSIVPQQPSPVTVSAAPHSSPVRQIQIPSVSPPRLGLAVGTGKALRRQPGTASMPRAKRATTKRTKLVRKKEPKQGRPSRTVTIAAKPVAVTGDSQEQEATVAQGIPSSAAGTIQPKPGPVSITANTPTVTSSEASTQSRPVSSVGSPQSTPKDGSVNAATQSGPTVSSACTTQSRTSVANATSVTPCTSTVGISSTQSQLIITSVVSLSTVTNVTCAADKPTVSAIVSSQCKQPAVAPSDSSTHLRPTVTQNRQAVTTTVNTVQTRSAAINGSSRQSRSTVTSACSTETRSPSTGVTSSAACRPSVSTVSSIESRPVVSLQSAQLTSSSPGQTKPANSQESQPTTQPQSQPVAFPSVPSTPTPCSGALSFSSPSVTVPMTMPSEYRKRVTCNRPSTQQMIMPTSTPKPSHPAELRVTAVSGREKEPQGEAHPSAAIGSVTSDAAPSRKDSTLPQQVYTLDHEALDQSQAPNRQTDSPISGGGRGFSVASMLPTGHSVSSSQSHFGPFTFTTEQADILAMLEQDSPGRRVGGCTVENPTGSTNTPTPAWEPNPKSHQASNSKERGAGQQTKLTKQIETPVAKPPSQVSVRGQAGEVAGSGPSGARHPQNISYSQSHSQPQSQSQTQNQAQSGTAGTLSVNNLIRPSSRQQQAYPGSPNLAGQQGSVPSPAGNSAHVSQPSTPGLPPCSGSVQLNEYTPLKSALMRPQVGVGEPRHIKDVSKRPAQDDVMLSSSNKRHKACPSASNVGCMEVKPLDHSQMMVPQLPPTASSIMTRINPEGVGTLFSGNTFMSTVLRPTESHCTPQMPAQEHNQPGVLHLPQGHPQHGAPQLGQHLGGNPYLKQQQQQQQEHQRHHLYQLQHHLTQPDPAQLHSLHQRSLQQEQHRLMSSRNLEQQLTSQPSNPASRPSDLGCAPSRQERHRVSSYSAEALIGKSSSSGEQQQQQRMGLHLQATRGTTQEQPGQRGYLDTSRVKGNIAHNPQSRLPPDHPGSADIQRVSECPPFKTLSGAGGGHQLGGFEVQVSRGGDMTPKSGLSSQRGPQGGFRMGPGPPGDGRPRGGYSGLHSGSQGVQIGAPGLPRDQEGCQQSFMQSLLEQTNHQRAVQCCPPVSMEYGCVPGSSAGDMQAKASSPSVPPTQKAPAMRLGEGNKGHIPQGSGNMGAHPGVRAGLPHPPTPHSSSEPGRTSAPSRPLTAVSQRSRHITQEAQSGKLRPGERPRSGSLRPGNPFEPDIHLLGRPQSGGEARRSSIVRFMADSAQVAGDNNLVPDQHLAQNFGFPFIPEGGMNPPPINANSTFIPPVSQPNSSRPSALLPVEPQNTLPSFYPSYPPAAHPSDIPLQYFSNQMFTSPGTDKSSSAPLNNRFGSILSPPRPVGFAQASFPLLSDMPPMPISNSSGITPHLSNFSLTSLFPEIATAMQPDGSAMPMSPLLSLSNTSSADSGKQPNRPAHNISHILGHDGSSAV
ncbi:unnamed protein product [Coregonus sp. 'balchen']|nr:unnamed protein product [Coregonus sp. 'balchen']